MKPEGSKDADSFKTGRNSAALVTLLSLKLKKNSVHVTQKAKGSFKREVQELEFRVWVSCRLQSSALQRNFGQGTRPAPGDLPVC